MRQFLDGKASVYALIAKDQLMSFQDLSCSACSARERAEVEASARSQREAAEARAVAGGSAADKRGRRGAGAGSSSSAAMGTEGGDWGAVAAASSLADPQMDGQWRAVSVCVAVLVVVWPSSRVGVCVRPAEGLQSFLLELVGWR